MTLLDPTRPELPAFAEPRIDRHVVRVAEAALLLLPMLVLAIPSGLLPFGLCLLASTVLGFAALRRASAQMGGTSVGMSGTSMASPHTAGVVALYLSTVPAATPSQVSSTLAAATTKGAVKSAGKGTTSPNLLFTQF